MHSPPSLHPPPSIHPISHIPRWCRRLRGPLASEFLPPAGHACPEWHIFGPTPRIQPSPDSSLSLVCVCVCVWARVRACERVCFRERGVLWTQHGSHSKCLKGSMGQIGEATELPRIIKRNTKIFYIKWSYINGMTLLPVGTFVTVITSHKNPPVMSQRWVNCGKVSPRAIN